MLSVKKLIVSVMQTNCYIVTDEKTGFSAVIDPGAMTSDLKSEILKLKDNLKYIILTHGHFDHIGAVNEIKNLANAEVIINKTEEDFLSDDRLNLSYMFDAPLSPVKPDILLNDNAEFMLGQTKIKMIETPGHTCGSACFIADDIIFTGDTVMKGTIGRTDFPTGSYAQMKSSLKRLMELKGDYVMFCGHGEDTTLNNEKQTNVYLGTTK